MKKVAGSHDGIWNKKIRNQNHFYPNLARSPISITNRDALKSFANSLSFGDRLNNSDLHYAGLSNKRAATKIVTKGNKTICLMSQASKTCRPKYFQWSRSTKLI